MRDRTSLALGSSHSTPLRTSSLNTLPHPQAMDFPVSLLNVLCESDAAGGKETAIDADVAGFACAPLSDNVEAMFGVPVDGDQMDPDIVSVMQVLAALLHKTILASILSEDTRLEEMTDQEDEDETFTKETIEKIRASDTLEIEDNAEMKNLAELLRACKNIIRWYLQYFLAIKGPVLPVPLRRLESHSMIELYLLIIERTAGEAENDVRQEVARQACLCLFYSTYSPSGNDEQIKRAQTHLVEKLEFLDILMRLLQTNNTPVVLVALVRIVHNLVTSLPGTVERAEETRAQFTESGAPWTTSLEGTNVDLRTLLTNILMWSLQTTPAFPGDVSDRRADLVMEILRILYVLRAGRFVLEDESTGKLVAYFLKLPNTEERAYRCKLAAISLLMDAPPEYSEQLVKQKGVLLLLAVLDKQVTQVVDLSDASSAAAAAVVPILSVLNKFCTHNDEFREKTKKFIFPSDAEAHFASLVAEQEKRPKKNMRSLDAPDGTLRWKLIKLMTWPESHIKRTSSELLWTMCDKNQTEFIYRTGLGNALPILSSKGFVDLPSELTS